MNNRKSQLLYSIQLILILTLITLLSVNIFQKKDSGKNLYKDSICSVVEVYSFDDEKSFSNGTAWFIDSNTLVTNHHVISFKSLGNRLMYTHIFVRFYDEEEYTPVTVIKYDEDLDLAFLSYSGSHKCVALSGASATIGEECFAIGNYKNHGLSFKVGRISLPEIILNYDESSSNYIQCDLSIGPGDSGAPLLNTGGRILGMITFRATDDNGIVDQNFAYSIPFDAIEKAYIE